MATPQKLSYTIPEAVKATGICRSKFFEYRDEGLVEFIKNGNKNLITHEALTGLLRHLAARSAA